jgi:hypothetical protein
MEICSRFPFSLHKHGKYLSRFAPDSKRVWEVVNFLEYREWVTQASLANDHTTSFFELYESLQKKAIVAWTKVIWKNENSNYNDIVLWAKDAYLNFVVLDSQSVMYSYGVNSCDNVMNWFQILMSSTVYESRAVSKSSNIFYSSGIQDSDAIWFCANMIGCKECIWCNGLINQSYCISNVSLEKQEYEVQKAEILNEKNEFQILWNKILKKPWINQWEDIEGQFNRNCNEIQQWYFNLNVTTWRNVVLGSGTGDSTEIYDVLSFGGTTAQHCYGCMWVGRNASHAYCSVEVSPSVHNVYYSYLLDSCSYCLWCIWLKNKSYCIFNKQYSKEERHDEVDTIFTQMESEWTLWSFFPWSINPFYFNDTVAYLMDDSFTKEEVEAQGYLRRDEPITVDVPEWVQTVKVSELGGYEGRLVDWKFTSIAGTLNPLPEGHPPFEGGNDERAWTIDPEIMKKVIVDEQWNAYRVIPMEYEFLVKHGLPLPRKHWLERIKQHFAL